MMRTSRAFTLIEVMVALVVSGLVVSLAYAAMQGGLETRERLARHHNETESLVTVRGMIRDALRHAIPGIRGGPDVFFLFDRVTATGVAADSLVFFTRGVVAPFGTSAAWRVSLSVDSAGLQFAAEPEALSSGTAVSATVVSVTGLDVRALGRGAGASWRGAWDDATVVPRAVALTLANAAGVTTPLVATLSLERLP
ncbi:MAG: PulJ/GspJ family protein [Gemmatimonadaceae bacterium]